MIKNFTYLFILILASQIAFSQGQTSDDIKWFGTVYLRPELDGRDFSNTTHPYFITMQRIAFGFEKQIYPNIKVFVEAMDNRIWGQPQSTRKSIANLDIHQGYLLFTNVYDLPVDFQIGRFEKEFNKKILGISNWQDVPRAFDGIDLRVKLMNNWDADIFYFVNSYPKNYIPATLPKEYPYPAEPDKGVYAYGLTTKYNLTKNSYLQFISLYEVQGKGNTTSYDKLTPAIDYINKDGNFDIWLHLGFQTGKTTTNNIEKTISAWGGHAFVAYDIDGIKPMLLVDINSGTKLADRGTKDNLYTNNFASGHIFWGIADYFNNIAVGTDNYGLNHFGARLTFNEKEPFSAYVEGCYFMTNVPFNNLDGKESSNIGSEIDIVLKYTYNKKMYIDWGNAIILPGDLWKMLYKSGGVVREDPAFYTYLRFYYAY